MSDFRKRIEPGPFGGPLGFYRAALELLRTERPGELRALDRDLAAGRCGLILVVALQPAAGVELVAVPADDAEAGQTLARVSLESGAADYAQVRLSSEPYRPAPEPAAHGAGHYLH